MDRNQPCECAVFGIDIGKNLFHVVGLDSLGAIVQRIIPARDVISILRTSVRNACWDGSLP